MLPRAGFKPSHDLSSDVIKRCCAEVIATTPQRILLYCIFKMFDWFMLSVIYVIMENETMVKSMIIMMMIMMVIMMTIVIIIIIMIIRQVDSEIDFYFFSG